MAVATKGGWTLRLPPGRTIYLVRFKHNGRRVEKSTGRTDPAEAAEEAAKIYADTVTGRRVQRPVSQDLTTAVASYLADFEMEVTPEWASVVTSYFHAHLIPFFGSFDAFTPASYLDYGRERLQTVTRASVRKELSALRRFVTWCNLHDATLPVVPSLAKQGNPGKRHKRARKRKAT